MGALQASEGRLEGRLGGLRPAREHESGWPLERLTTAFIETQTSTQFDTRILVSPPLQHQLMHHLLHH